MWLRLHGECLCGLPQFQSSVRVKKPTTHLQWYFLAATRCTNVVGRVTVNDLLSRSRGSRVGQSDLRTTGHWMSAWECMQPSMATATQDQNIKLRFFPLQVSPVAGVLADCVKLCSSCFLTVSITRLDGAGSTESQPWWEAGVLEGLIKNRKKQTQQPLLWDSQYWLSSCRQRWSPNAVWEQLIRSN